jgi:hypothetical protein
MQPRPVRGGAFCQLCGMQRTSVALPCGHMLPKSHGNIVPPVLDGRPDRRR